MSSLTCIGVVVSALLAAPPTIDLRPGMPTVKPTAVPPLHAIKDKQADADRVDGGLRIAPERPYCWVALPGEPFDVTVTAEGRGQSDRAVLTVWDWLNRPVAQRAFKVPAEAKLRFRVAGRGTYLLTLDRFAGSTHQTRAARGFSICPDNRHRIAQWDTGRFFIGTCSYPDRQHWRGEFGTMRPKGLTNDQSADLEAELSARLGVQVTRMSAGTDAHFDMYNSRGVRPHLQLGHGKGPVLAKYAHVKDPKWRYPCQEASSRAWFVEAAKRFGKRAFSFEIYNEPDNRDFWRATPEQFITATGWALDALAKHAPDTPVANGGYTLHEKDMYLKYVRAFKGKTTWVAFHTHNTLPRCMKLFAEHVRLHREAGYKNPVWVNTEMGMCDWRLDRGLHMAAAAGRKILYFWAHGVRGVLMYRTRDRHGPRVSGSGWGYLDHFFCPRFKYGAAAALIDWCAGARFESILTETPAVHAYAFAAPGRKLAAVFDPRDKRRPTDVTLTSDATRALILDPMGNPTKAPDPGRVTVQAGFYPVMVVFEGASSVKVAN